MLIENEGQPAMPANMGRRVGHTADPNAKLGGRRAAGRPKRIKADKCAVRLGQPVEVALKDLILLLLHA